jgi:DNA-binding NtrC family response regulator
VGPSFDGPPPIIRIEEAPETPLQPYKDARAAVVREFEHTYLTRLLTEAGGNVSRAARTAKMDRSHLIDLLQRHGLKE